MFRYDVYMYKCIYVRGESLTLRNYISIDFGFMCTTTSHSTCLSDMRRGCGDVSIYVCHTRAYNTSMRRTGHRPSLNDVKKIRKRFFLFYLNNLTECCHASPESGFDIQ